MKFYHNLSFKYFVAISAVLSLMVIGIFVHFYRLQKKAILGEVKNQARILCTQILLTRSWLADMGGVYVRKRKGLEVNPYLGSEGKIEGKDGQLYLLRNPAMVTRELSEYAKQEGLYQFRLTSDRYINPANAPDGIERFALRLFKEKKQKEYFVQQESDGQKVLRLIVPLYIKKSCLKCHQYQGYQLGELRGCISILIPAGEAYRKIIAQRNTLIMAACFILIVTVFTLYTLNRSLIIRPINRLREKIRRFEDDVNTAIQSSTRKDEIGALEKGFYQMTRTIKNSHQEMRREILRATEEQRRLNSELKRANLQLQERDEVKTNFLATVSHELRTPLTTIKGGVEYLLKTVEGKEQKRFLDVLERNIQQLIRMVNNLIDLARIELNRIELELEEANLKELLDEVLLLFDGFIRERKITLRREGFRDIIIPIDYRRMNQVFLNLLHNAVKFSPEGGEIIVKMDEDDNYVNVAITDHGAGIDPRKISTIFTRYRCQDGGKQKGEGSGLGLAIAQGLVHAHGGRIEVESLPGDHTTFTVILPKYQKKEEKFQGDPNGGKKDHSAC